MNDVRRVSSSASLGAAIVVFVLDAAVRTFLLPRVASVRLSRTIAAVVGRLFQRVAGRRGDLRSSATAGSRCTRRCCSSATRRRGSRCSLVAFAFLFVAPAPRASPRASSCRAPRCSPSAPRRPPAPPSSPSATSRPRVGLTLLALLIAFIPTLYGAFQRRELVGLAAVGARGRARHAVGHHRDRPERERLRAPRRAVARVGDVVHRAPRDPHHPHDPQLLPDPDPGPDLGGARRRRSSTRPRSTTPRSTCPPSATAGLCIRSGWLALRGLADYFRVPYPHTPDGTEAISITREEFELALDHLGRSGVPVLADHDAAWLDFVGWRVNYDAIIERLHVRSRPRASTGMRAPSRCSPAVEPSRHAHRRRDRLRLWGQSSRRQRR